jgi:hypothetical protein
MPPRSAKGKAPSKATLASTAAVAASTDSSSHLPSSGELAGQFFDLYNDLLAAKSDVLSSAPGAERKRAIAALGAELVCVFIKYFSSFLIISQNRLVPLLDQMTARSPTGWELSNTQSMTSWAEELASIPSSTLARLCIVLTDCDARLSSLAKSSELDTDVTPRKSVRVRRKVPTEASASGPTPLQAGDTYINAIKVCLLS